METSIPHHQTVLDLVAERDLEVVRFDGLDEAIIGLCERFGQPTVLLYDYEACVKIFMQRDGMSCDDASEYMEFNVTGAWVGDTTPTFAYGLPLLPVFAGGAVGNGIPSVDGGEGH